MKRWTSFAAARRLIGLSLIGAGLAGAGLLSASSAEAAEGGVKVGLLTCNESSGWGFVFGSSRALNCTFSPTRARVERYVGHINKYGVDIGYQRSGVLVWGVIAPSGNIAPGSLSGSYGGVTAGASVALGVSANGLIGGSNRTISLPPLSVAGTSGLNVAAGIGAINLHYLPNGGYRRHHRRG